MVKMASNDWYLEDRSRLNGRPKRTIVDYAEQNGILVPRRFDSLQEAKNSGLPILIRSEHPREYSEFSGLLDSISLDGCMSRMGKEGSENVHFEPKNCASVEEFKDGYLKFSESHAGTPMFISYCNLAGIDLNQFKQQLSFSVWEKLEGVKRIVVADSSIKGRYHIQNSLFGKEDEKSWNFDYFILDNGKLNIALHKSWKFPELRDTQELVDIYERIRNLSRFDKNNCPIMEFITHNNKHYFLQYHRGRNFDEAKFILDRPINDGETEALFVRGHTSEQGIEGKVTAIYSDEWGRKDFGDWDVSKSEFGSFDLHNNFSFSSFMYPLRRLQLKLARGKDVEWEFLKFVGGHALNSALYIPEISAITGMELFKDNDEKPGPITGEDMDKMESVQRGRESARTGTNFEVGMRIISDGRKAYLKRL